MNTSARFLLRIPRKLFDQMVSQALAEQPNECCGLLAGRLTDDGTAAEATERYSLVNELHSPNEFQSEARSMLAAVKDMRWLGTDVLAIYHSHPSNAPIPSKKDLERNWISGVMYLIIGLAGDVPDIRGWWLLEESYLEAAFEIVGPG